VNDEFATATSDASASSGLPSEQQVIIVPPESARATAGSTRLQLLSATVFTAIYLSVQSALEKQHGMRTLDRVENATAISAPEQSCTPAVLGALNAQPVSELEDGMTRQLGAQIATCIGDFGAAALEDLARVALRDQAPPEALSHAMRWVGRLSDPRTFQERLLMLTRSLEAPSDIVKDGATLGLVALGSAAAIPALDAAIAREKNTSLREDLLQAAAYLRSKSR
jgi:hypothetical protein